MYRYRNVVTDCTHNIQYVSNYCSTAMLFAVKYKLFSKRSTKILFMALELQ
jgi:hypothetical protein